MSKYNLVNDDCLEILPEIPDNSIDMVLADLVLSKSHLYVTIKC